MAKAIIFDVDGTLVDSVDQHAEAWCQAFAHFGKTIAFPDMRSQIGKGGDQLLPVFLSKDEIKDFGEDLDKYRSALFKKTFLPGIKGFPKVRELFEKLTEEGLQVVLASSAKGDELQAYKKAADITDLVQDETSKDDAKRSKPHPDIFQAAFAKLHDVDLADALVIGDTPYDGDAARKAGNPFVGVLCGGFPPEDLKKTDALRLYKDPADLLMHLQEWTSLSGS